MSNFHTPVMLKEVLEYLEVKPGCWYVDCNLGGGGHTSAILQAGGKVIGIDLDLEALEEVAKNYKLQIISKASLRVNDKLGLRAYSENLILVQGNFVNLDKIISEIASASPRNDANGPLKISGVLFDLGVSSHQMDVSSRGFSFGKDAPLDMRMDTTTPWATAADLVNGLHEGELAQLFVKFGEEAFAKPIARRIVASRKAQPITTTLQLAKIVESVKRRKPGERIHPATQIFQALRIAVNDELNNLKEVLPKAFEILEPGGRLVVISFHSLEDRIVKEFSKSVVESGKGIVITKKTIEPSKEEIIQNPRSRSAKMRVIEKL